MESLDNAQFPNSTQHLHASYQAITNFIESIQDTSKGKLYNNDQTPCMYYLDI